MNQVSELCCYVVLLRWDNIFEYDFLGKSVPVRVGIAVSDAVRYIATHQHLFTGNCRLKIEY